ncbi:hemagglutinin repeat-containing protein, partial [bacterium]|nr:hemagglutinin repeat-containing protein [bacterium]MBU1434807.1 hemagglutinin repeat-containing protein [bacterium]MBU1502795.1 hemagglutinin repeat-containing protein [bacterium]
MKQIKQSLAVLLSYTLAFMPLHAANLQTDGSTQTNLDKARNDVPVVNIANPNAIGLSHNKFKEYNVGKEGLILNNSKDTTVNTQLGGYIFGNSNLTSNAKVILNEVTSTSRSQLNGYTEVAGERSDLIIANPNGLSVNGAGFINTSNVTLTTAKPILNDGRLESLNVLGGDISIDGEGLDAMGPDSTYIYTHFLKLNAQIHAKNLEIKLGKNNIDSTTQQITASTNSNEVALLLDASALGGMYVNRISLVGTDKGLGVNLPPEVLASTGDISITNDGNIILNKISAKQNIEVKSLNSDIEVNGNTYSANDTKLESKNKILLNNNDLKSKNKIEIISDFIINESTIVAGVNEDNSLNDIGVLNLTANTITNKGNIQSSDVLSMNAISFKNENNIVANGELKIEENDFIINSGLIHSNSNLNIDSKNISNSKDITASNDLYIDATNINTTNGEISATNVDIKAKVLESDNTNIISLDSMNLNIDNKILNNGLIQTKNILNLTTDSLINNETIFSVTDMSMYTKDIINNAIINSSNNLIITSNNLTNNRTIFSGSDMYLYTKDTLLNNESAYILAVNNLTMAADNSNAKTQTIENKSATIETLQGDINIYANDFANKATKAPTISSYQESSIYYTKNLGDDWRTRGYITTTIESLDKTEYVPSTLMSGKNVYIDANTNNEYSLMAASENMTFVGSLINEANLVANKIVRTTGYVQHCDSNSWPKSGCSWYHKSDTDTTVLTLIDNADSTIQAGGTIAATVSSLVNSTVRENEAISSSATIDNEIGIVEYKNTGNNVVSLVIPEDDYGLFVKNTNPLSKFLIETNPEFALYDNFISSEYMMSHIRYDSEVTSKKIGDALYENTIIRDSVLQQTGRRFLNKDIKNDNDQFKYLMDNAIQASEDLELSPGISLNKEQIDALTQDIVWMEEQVVAGQKVLVPVVYIANIKNYQLEGARIIAGSNINIEASDAISNISGDIIAGEDINLQAANDISNISANIEAKNLDLASTDGNIINKRSAEEMTFFAKGSKAKTTLVGKESQIVASNNLNVNAGKDIDVTGSKLQAKNININAANVAIATTIDNKYFSGGDSKNYIKENSTTNLASNLNADNININSIDTTTIKGSNLNASGNMKVTAKKIDVLAVNDTEYRESYSSSKDAISSSSSLDASLNESVASSSLSANNILLNAQQDMNLESVNIDVKNSAEMSSANGNINFTAKAYTNAEVHEQSSSSFGGLVGSHSIDALSQTKLGNSSTTAQNNIAVGGKNINIMATDLKTNGGDIQLSANENVNIISGTEEKSEQHLKESTSFNLGLSGSRVTYAQKTKDATANTSLTNKASNIDTKNLTIESGQDTNVIASNITANGMKVDSARDFNILVDKNVATSKEDHSKQELGVELTLNEKEASLFAGFWEEDNGKSTTTSSVVKSNINVGTLDVTSKDQNIIGSDVIANDITVNSENIRVLADTTNTNTDTYTKSIKAGVSVGVSQNISNAVEAVQDVGNAKSNSATISRGLKAYDAVTSALTKPVNAGVQAVYEQSQTNTNTNNDQVVSSTLYANNTMKLNAKEDIEVAGSTIASNNTLELNAKNINLHSEQQNYSSDSSSSSLNAKADLYGTNIGNITMGAQKSDLGVNGIQQINSHIYATNKATLTSEEDTILKGATVDANELEVTVGKNLVMQSLQDTQTINGSSAGGTVSGKYAMPTGVSVNTGSTKGDKQWVNEVSSLNANEKIKVAVNENTTLTGA